MCECKMYTIILLCVVMSLYTHWLDLLFIYADKRSNELDKFAFVSILNDFCVVYALRVAVGVCLFEILVFICLVYV